MVEITELTGLVQMKATICFIKLYNPGFAKEDENYNDDSKGYLRY